MLQRNVGLAGKLHRTVIAKRPRLQLMLLAAALAMLTHVAIQSGSPNTRLTSLAALRQRLSAMTDAIDQEKLRVLKWLGSELDQAVDAWMAVGGLAGNLWGSSWPLHDLDVEVSTLDLPLLAARWAPFVTSAGRYIDDEFDIELLRLRVDRVDIDVSGADNAWGFTRSGVRTPLANTLSRRVLRPLADGLIPCQRLEDLIAYKTIIGRRDDLAELSRLAARDWAR